jgi:hypothetical protein
MALVVAKAKKKVTNTIRNSNTTNEVRQQVPKRLSCFPFLGKKRWMEFF